MYHDLVLSNRMARQKLMAEWITKGGEDFITKKVFKKANQTEREFLYKTGLIRMYFPTQGQLMEFMWIDSV